MSPRWGSTPRLTDRQSQCDFDFDLKLVRCNKSPLKESCKGTCEQITWSVQLNPRYYKPLPGNEPTVYKMWKPWRLTTLWASTACYRAFWLLPWRLPAATVPHWGFDFCQLCLSSHRVAPISIFAFVSEVASNSERWFRSRVLRDVVTAPKYSRGSSVFVLSPRGVPGGFGFVGPETPGRLLPDSYMF
jgi:hypothetical protein